MEWGNEIAVNGVRPDWLRDGTPGQWHADGSKWVDNHNDCWTDYEATDWQSVIAAIRLPSDHPYYTVQRYNEQHGTSFMYWPGGDAAPADWDGGDVLTDEASDGMICPHDKVACWSRGTYVKIIGYTRRSEPARDTVAVERMSEDECDHLRRQFIPPSWDEKINAAHEYAWLRCARHFNLIRPEPTEAERIAAETGVPVETVQRVLDARGA